MNRTMIAKRNALAKMLGCSKKEINEDGLTPDDSRFSVWGAEYLVLTDDEADQAARAAILDSVWAFNPSFLVAHMSDNGIDEEIIRLIQEAKYEDASKPLLKLIDDVDHFVDDAIGADGRGHFLSHYDGEECEQGPYFIYRTN